MLGNCCLFQQERLGVENLFAISQDLPQSASEGGGCCSEGEESRGGGGH